MAYINFMQTQAAELVNKSSFEGIEEDTAFIGGDGRVPSWSSLLNIKQYHVDELKIMSTKIITIIVPINSVL